MVKHFKAKWTSNDFYKFLKNYESIGFYSSKNKNSMMFLRFRTSQINMSKINNIPILMAGNFLFCGIAIYGDQYDVEIEAGLDFAKLSIITEFMDFPVFVDLDFKK